MPYKYGLDSPVEWANFGVTPVRGLCPYIAETGGLDGDGGCYYCYMKTMFKRFRNSKKPLDPTLRRDIKDMYWVPPKPSKVAVCLNLDLFHPSVPDKWKKQTIARTSLQAPDSIFIYLTKCPQEYNKFRFPVNSWLGTTWDGLEYTRGNIQFLANVNTQSIKFVSFEPLLTDPPENILKPFEGLLHWVIIGGFSDPHQRHPPWSWVNQLIKQAWSYDMAVWVKQNCGYFETIHEYPDNPEKEFSFHVR